MNPGKITAFLAAPALLLLCATAHAEPLSLQKALDMARSGNLGLSAAEREAEAAKWGQAKSVSGYLPKVFVDSSVTRIDPDSYDKIKKSDAGTKAFMESLGQDTSKMKPSGYEDTYSTSVQVVQPIFNGGKEIVAIDAATKQKHLKEFAEKDAEADTVNRVKQAFFGAQKADALEKTAKEAVQLATQTLSLTKARFEIGQVSKAEVLRWESQLAQAEGSLIEAQNAARIARLGLNAVLGAELNHEWELEEMNLADAGAPDTAASAETGLPDFSLVSAHPTIREMDATVGLSESERSLAVTEILPKANFVFAYGWEKDDTWQPEGDHNWTAAISLEIPIFQSLGGAFGIAEAHKNLLAARLKKDDFRRAFLQRAYTASLNVRTAAKRVDAAKKEVAFAEETMTIVEARQKVGAATNLDLLDAQYNYLQAKTRMVTAAADRRIAEAEWDYVTAQ